MTEQDIVQGFEEIRKLFRETDERLSRELRERDERLDGELRERDERLNQMLDQERQEWQKKIDRSHQEQVEEFREIRELFKETDRRFKETDRRFKETDRRFKETDQKIKRLEELFTGQWGKLIEALVKPSAVKLFQERGIAILRVSPRVEFKRNGGQMEVDLLLENDDAVVLIEVKTTLKVEYVREFLDKLKRFLHFSPKYREYQIHGAVAGVHIEEGADRFAYQRGLFVLGLGGDGMIRILNDLKFKPKDFCKTD